MRLLVAKKEKQALQQIITTTSTPQEWPGPIRSTTTEPVADEAKQTSAHVKTLEIVEDAIQMSRAIGPGIRSEKRPSLKMEKRQKHPPGKGTLRFLFTGYTIGSATKMDNQFPPENENDIKAAIQNVLGK